jgi:DNA-binding NarL/FixJ family response regulator
VNEYRTDKSVAPRLLLVDDVPEIRKGLRSLIQKETDWDVCGEAENGKVALGLVAQLRPDVILLDLSMPVMNGFEAARKIRDIAPQAQILLFTLHSSPQLAEEARKIGVKGVLSKSENAGSTVLPAVRSLLAS